MPSGVYPLPSSKLCSLRAPNSPVKLSPWATSGDLLGLPHSIYHQAHSHLPPLFSSSLWLRRPVSSPWATSSWALIWTPVSSFSTCIPWVHLLCPLTEYFWVPALMWHRALDFFLSNHLLDINIQKSQNTPISAYEKWSLWEITYNIFLLLCSQLWWAWFLTLVGWVVLSQKIFHLDLWMVPYLADIVKVSRWAHPLLGGL